MTPSRFWISPLYHVNGVSLAPPIWVLNPTKEGAEVTLEFYRHHHGVLESTFTASPGPGSSFDISLSIASGSFWVYIRSNQPVIPWGETHAHSPMGDRHDAATPDLHYCHPMAFYNAENLQPARKVAVEWDDLPAKIQKNTEFEGPWIPK